MRECFKGWRRKAGVATLGLACVLAVLWVRSLTIADFIAFRVNRQVSYDVFTNDSRLTLERSINADLGGESPLRWFGYVAADASPLEDNYENVEREWRWLGFLFTSETRTNPKSRSWSIPFWSIVIPLTLLSAYLLSKRPPVKRSEDTHPDGTAS